MYRSRGEYSERSDADLSAAALDHCVFAAAAVFIGDLTAILAEHHR